MLLYLINPYRQTKNILNNLCKLKLIALDKKKKILIIKNLTL